jgi:hypothetical protein
MVRTAEVASGSLAKATMRPWLGAAWALVLA